MNNDIKKNIAHAAAMVVTANALLTEAITDLDPLDLAQHRQELEHELRGPVIDLQLRAGALLEILSDTTPTAITMPTHEDYLAADMAREEAREESL